MPFYGKTLWYAYIISLFLPALHNEGIHGKADGPKSAAHAREAQAAYGTSAKRSRLRTQSAIASDSIVDKIDTQDAAALEELQQFKYLRRPSRCQCGGKLSGPAPHPSGYKGKLYYRC